MGQINIGGTKAVQLKGYTDASITSDQAFTFPDTGGELVTAPVGGQVVGYQQGLWKPTIAGAGKTSPDEPTDVWMYEGVVNSPTGLGGPSPYINPELAVFQWWRIGNTVTVTNYNQFLSQGSGEITLEWRGLPYPIAPPLEGQIYNPFTGTCAPQTGKFSPNIASGAICSIVPYYWTGLGGGDFITFRYFGGTVPNQTGDLTLKSADVNRAQPVDKMSAYLQFQTTYITNDTTWQPINGATFS